MVAHAEPLEILLQQPLLSEDEVREDIYDTEYYVKRHKELMVLKRVLTISTIALLAAYMFLEISFAVKPPVPVCNTHGVISYLLWSVGIVFSMVALVDTVFDWWKTRPVQED